jgi:hypothetical protein
MFGLPTRKAAMGKHILLLTLGIFCLFITSCISTSKSENKHFYQSRNYVNPTQVPVDWKNLYSTNNSSKIKQFLEYSQETKFALNEKEIPYAWKGIPQNWNASYNKADNKYEFMRINGVDCTRFLWHLYAEKMKLPFNSKHLNAPILSRTFAQKRSTSELKNFVPLKKIGAAFKPRTGDILAFPGHALAVVDPDRCIAIQSASWLCKKMGVNGSCFSADTGKNAGVSIYKLMNKGDCNNGLWKQLDSPKNKFTSGWRHKALNTWIEKLPSRAYKREIITLVGYNISRRFIYFAGTKTPSKTSYAKSQLKSSNGYKLEVVTLKIPTNARSGKLRIYWGNSIKPDINMTVLSNEILTIDNNQMFSSK